MLRKNWATQYLESKITNKRRVLNDKHIQNILLNLKDPEKNIENNRTYLAEFSKEIDELVIDYINEENVSISKQLFDYSF